MKEFVVKERYELEDFIALISHLRSDKGCPWDQVQTHGSIRRNLLEEAYELAETIDMDDKEHMKEELGDVLMQVLFHTDIEADAGVFTLEDVADHACKKLVSRHPNVFGEKTDLDWDALKRIERGERTVASEMETVSRTLPALWRADKIQKKAAKVGYDWPNVHDALDKVVEEAGELRQGIDACDADNIMEEIGDLLFATVDTARKLGIDPEQALHGACEKTMRRFAFMEAEAARQGRRFEELSLIEKEELHQLARRDLEGKTPEWEMLERFKQMM